MDPGCRFVFLAFTVFSSLTDVAGSPHKHASTDEICQHAYHLHDTWRGTGNDGGNNCDIDIREGWYRVLKSDGTPARIPTVCIKNNACGTGIPLRIDTNREPLPLAGKTINATICGSYSILGLWDCCVLKKPTKIHNCGDFYVYWLTPTDRCAVAYCVQDDERRDEPWTAKTGEMVKMRERTRPVRNADLSPLDKVTSAAPIECDKDMIMCEDGLQCIKKRFLCDAIGDCNDESDERNCTKTKTCPEGLSACPDGKCKSECKRDTPTSDADTTYTFTFPVIDPKRGNKDFIRSFEFKNSGGKDAKPETLMSNTPDNKNAKPETLISKTPDNSTNINETASDSNAVWSSKENGQIQNITNTTDGLTGTPDNTPEVTPGTFNDTASNTTQDETTTPNSNHGNVTMLETKSDKTNVLRDDTSKLMTSEEPMSSVLTSSNDTIQEADHTVMVSTTPVIKSYSVSPGEQDMSTSYPVTHFSETQLATDVHILPSWSSAMPSSVSMFNEIDNVQSTIVPSKAQRTTSYTADDIETPLLYQSTQGSQSLFKSQYITDSSDPLVTTNYNELTSSIWPSGEISSDIAKYIEHTPTTEVLRSSIIQTTPKTTGAIQEETEPQVELVEVVFEVPDSNINLSSFYSRLRSAIAELLNEYYTRRLRRRETGKHFLTDDIVLKNGTITNSYLSLLLGAKFPGNQTDKFVPAADIRRLLQRDDFQRDLNKKLQDLNVTLAEITWDINVTEVTNSTSPSVRGEEEEQSIFARYFGLILTVIVISGFLLFVVIVALIYLHTKDRIGSWQCPSGGMYSKRMEKQLVRRTGNKFGTLQIESPFSDVDILKDERSMTEKPDDKNSNGVDDCEVGQKENDEGWIVPITKVVEDNTFTMIEDTRL